MVCGRCGKVFDENKQDYCGFCRTVHTEKGEECLHLIMVDDAIPAGAKLC